MDIKGRFSVSLTLVISALLATVCFLVFTQVRDKLISTAEQTLNEHMEHEWNHLQMRHGEVASSSKTLRNDNIHFQIKKNGRVVVDNLPLAALSVPQSGLVRKMTSSKDGESIELLGHYSLQSLDGYLSTLRRVLLLACLIGVLFIVPTSWFFIRSLLDPFGRLATRTAELDAESLSFRFPPPKRRDEYGVLVSSFNSLLVRLEKSFNQVRRFATNASHELRTPLTVIRGEAEVLLRKPRDVSDYETGLRNIVSQTQHLDQMVNRLLFLANLERMTNEPMNSSIDVKKTITGTITALQALYPSARKSIELNTDGRLLFTGHRELFSSVVTNLLENAVKYANSKILVQVRKDVNGLLLTIDDDGPGVPDRLKEEIFEPLFLAPIERSLNGEIKKGNGLGLSIVKACVEIAKGKISLADSPIGGLSVRVLLPELT